jgi:hypothetical protein
MASRIVLEQAADGHYDSLNGRRLKDGDRLHIKWPSGIIQPNVTVCIHAVVVGTLVNGEVVELPCHKAYFRLLATGSEAPIYLRGFEATKA